MKKILNFLGSMGFAISLLTVLAAACVVATIAAVSAARRRDLVFICLFLSGYRMMMTIALYSVVLRAMPDETSRVR